MNDNYINFFKDIDQIIAAHFDKVSPLNLKIIGFAALCLSGLPDRGTKDIDMMEIDAVANSTESNIITLILKEFGKKSPGLYRHGMYLDVISESIVWLPPKPRFELYRKFENIEVSLLDPTDVCVTKVFSYFKSSVPRANDRQDIIDSLDKNLITCDRFVRRVDGTLSIYETHAEAPEIYPKVIRFINGEIVPRYGGSNVTLGYEIPSWMENM